MALIITYYGDNDSTGFVGFRRIPSNGEHYKCYLCGAMFSDMTDTPREVMLQVFETHRRNCK